ncbi:hypothetical protein N7489_008334 [Penicillium chrysogenum]|uniref:uncharacterized protein n=1 Tax=Penicillium chrysogenum TaxID=5076 RepID=UPI0024DF1F07|nr:uncharacterized protein N7489_008334 [Penicillium chrysogenum]KAJ5238243.1 hypothetical protein N7489_008334 [Penicillium chrysogenum]
MDSPRRSTVAAQGSDTPRERSSGPARGFTNVESARKNMTERIISSAMSDLILQTNRSAVR